MLRRTKVTAKCPWKRNPAGSSLKGPPDALRPITPEFLGPHAFVGVDYVYPRNKLKAWQAEEFLRQGRHVWPKEVAYYNAGDNLELTPAFRWRLWNRNKDMEWWGEEANVATVIEMMPEVERDRAVWLPRVESILAAHVARFGASHAIYNAVMQCYAFAREKNRVADMVADMKMLGLLPDAQSYVNQMLCIKLCQGSKQSAFEVFQEGVKEGVLNAVMRLDTEFDMWWDQISRFGSFTGGSDQSHNSASGKNVDAPLTPNIVGGHMNVKQGGWLAGHFDEAPIDAKPMPRDMWAIWGWDRSERKYETVKKQIHEEASRRGNLFYGSGFGTKYRSVKREPWFRYKGLFPWDHLGPRIAPRHRRAAEQFFIDQPPAGDRGTQISEEVKKQRGHVSSLARWGS